MIELHWTAAVVLLAIAVLSNRAAVAGRPTIVSWEDFARERGLEPAPHPTAGRGRRAR
jgi:hypothetical protein